MGMEPSLWTSLHLADEEEAEFGVDLIAGVLYYSHSPPLRNFPGNWT